MHAADTVLVAVDTTVAFINNLPLAYAGNDTTVYIPDPQVTLSAAGSMDPDGTIMSYLWTKVSGPAPGNIQHSSYPLTEITGLVAGEYIFQVQVTDNQGASSTDQVRVLVDALLRPNKQPVAKAGKDTTVYHPIGNLLLSAAGSYDPDGRIVSYKWKQLSGPSTAELVNAFSANSTVSRLQPGTYVFQLSVTDNRGAVAIAKIKIVVRARTLSVVPGKGAINIYIDESLASPLYVSVFDIGGRLMQQQKLVNHSLTSSFTIDVESLRRGLYFLRLTDASGKKLSQEFLR
jgi:hypothetical protein